MPEYPSIPDVTFRPIPTYHSGSRSYAISSDGRVWIGEGRSWTPVTPFIPGFVFLRGGANPESTTRLAIADLYRAAFHRDLPKEPSR